MTEKKETKGQLPETKATVGPEVESDTLVPPTADAVSESQRIVSSSGGYALIRKLGEGQFGQVWLAKAPGGVDVALKTINFPLGHRTSQLELRALEAMKGLRHSYLVQVQAYWVEDDHLVIALELADGNLEQRLEEYRVQGQSGIPQRELLTFFREAAEAIDYLHENNIMHRDIKPANIMLLGGHVKVADFGLARIAQRDDISVTSTSLGTPLYMAPEVWHGKAGNRSDQYSLAITYAELRLGRAPFPGKTFADVMNDHVRGTADLGHLSVAEKKVIFKALSKDPAHRFESCSKFVEALEKVLAPAKPQRRRKPLVALVLVAAMSVVLAAFLLLIAPGRGFDMSTRAQWKVRAGVSAAYTIQFENLKSHSVPQLVFSGVPDGVDFRTVLDDTSAHVDVTVDLNTDPRSYEIRVDSSNPNDELAFTLQVASPDCYVPNGCEPAKTPDNRLVAGHYRQALYQQIDWISPGQLRVPFVLIHDTASERAFYIMVNKVTNELYSEFAQSAAGTVTDEWKLGAATDIGQELPAEENPTLPVFRVHVYEAHQCAVWMGGRLPSVQQWNAAAEMPSTEPAESDRTGPFQGTWSPEHNLEIGFGRMGQGPLPAGTAKDDVTHRFHVRDMAGNGFEWTRDVKVAGLDRTVPLSAADIAEYSTPMVELRGRGFGADEPLLWQHLWDELELAAAEYEHQSGDISFRVVLEARPPTGLSD